MEQILFNLSKERPFADVLRLHAERYCGMTPCDAVKLIYQATFGVGHLLADADTVRGRVLEEEKKVVPAGDCPDVEEIGGGFSRVYLNRGVSAGRVAALFLDAGAKVGGTEEMFLERLALLRERTDAGLFPFGRDALEAYLTDYLADGIRAVSHSETYRAAYRPAYRVVSADMAELLPLFRELDGIVAEKGHAVLVIDGFCASGKSTLAARIADVYGARLIHTDDFFLPPPKRTPERFAEPGGNVDYERFAEEVVAHLEDDVLTYGVFDCSAMAVTRDAVLPRTDVTVIEGAYALHPAFGDYADVRAFMETGEAEQKRRILGRDGAEMWSMFEERWIPFERAYEAAFGVRGKCKYRILT